MKHLGFMTWSYDTEDIVVGYFRKAPAETVVARPVSMFTFNRESNRSSVWAFPRGTPFRNPAAAKGSEILVKSVWNMNLLLLFFSSCLQRGDTICDLFAGTATATIIAATLLCCHSVVVDKYPEHLHLCQTRLSISEQNGQTEEKI